MAHHQQHQRDSNTVQITPIVTSHDSRPMESLQILEDEVALDVDEPPDEVLKFKRLPIRSPALTVITDPLAQAIEKPKQQSLLTRGLSSEAATTLRPRSVVSSYSNDSIVSTTDLTSDGGLTSPARTTTPSPPLALTVTNLNPLPPALHKSETVVFAPEEPPRKRCITFACGKPPTKTAEVAVEKKPDPAPVKKQCTIKFACPAKPAESGAETKKPAVSIVTKPTSDASSTPKKLTPKASFTRSPVAAKNKRHSDALRFHEFASRHLEEDEWVHEKSRRQSKLTIKDTLRKENEFRKLGEQAAAEAREAEREEDEAAMNVKDDDEDDNDLDEDPEDDDEENQDDSLDDDDDDDDVDTDGNESDNEAGFAESDDDEAEEDSDYQFWTNGLTTAATSADYHEHIRNRHRSDSASSIGSVIPSRAHHEQPSVSKVKKHRRRPKMRPATPELPDSTDFVCGTLDEDRPLEAAYIACIAQRKLAKQGILPQDFDPSFPTSDPEQDPSDQEDKNSAGSHDGAWAAGRFDDFEVSQHRHGRHTKSRKHEAHSPSISPKRVKSPCPRNRVLAHTPPPNRRLFGQSPRRNRSPATTSHPASPDASRRPSYEDKHVGVPKLAQRPNSTQTKSLPRTPNPFWKEHRRQRKGIAAPSDEEGQAIHSRGPIDIVQGLEDKRRRRKEKFWLTHYRKEAREKEKDRRRQPPGRGAKRMRELGLEAADRCKGYGQRLPLVLSV